MSAYAALWTVSAESIADPAEEAALIEAAKAGDERATLRLFAAYVAAVRGIVAQYASTLGLEDARQAALLGFLEVVAAHDPARSPRLAGQIRVRLHDALTEAASSSAGGFTVPARTLRRFFGILARADGDVEEAAKLAPAYEMSGDTFYAVLAAVKADESLDLEIETNGDESVSVLDEIAAPREIVDAEDRILCDLAFRAVTPRENNVISLAYGFADYDPQPDAVIGDRLGFSRLKALRIRQAGLTKMRAALGA